MKDFTWKVFCETGNIDTYLLFKELEDDRDGMYLFRNEETAEDTPLQ